MFIYYPLTIFIFIVLIIVFVLKRNSLFSVFVNRESAGGSTLHRYVAHPIVSGTAVAYELYNIQN